MERADPGRKILIAALVNNAYGISLEVKFLGQTACNYALIEPNLQFNMKARRSVQCEFRKVQDSKQSRENVALMLHT